MAPTSVFLPGKSHEQRSLAGYGPLGRERVRHDLATKQQQREDTQWNKHRFFDLQTSQTSVFSFVKWITVSLNDV